jgi:hypothetical protein
VGNEDHCAAGIGGEEAGEELPLSGFVERGADLVEQQDAAGTEPGMTKDDGTGPGMTGKGPAWKSRAFLL